jgi:D-alanyl-D-alanine dipeptidase
MKTTLNYIFALITCCVSAFAAAQDTINREQEGFIRVNLKAEGIQNRMAYADTANFMHQKLYPCAECYLRPEVAAALKKANLLAKEKNLRLVIYDCYRPYPLQFKMFEIVNDPRYVAKPGKGSNHNRGAAVDISLADAEGNLLDMGSGFDEFTERSHYVADGIPKEARKNRRLLRRIMQKAGFSPYPHEWWHFDYIDKKYETARFIWDCD